MGPCYGLTRLMKAEVEAAKADLVARVIPKGEENDEGPANAEGER